jgi:hypothetical protein
MTLVHTTQAFACVHFCMHFEISSIIKGVLFAESRRLPDHGHSQPQCGEELFQDGLQSGSSEDQFHKILNHQYCITDVYNQTSYIVYCL